MYHPSTGFGLSRHFPRNSVEHVFRRHSWSIYSTSPLRRKLSLASLRRRRWRVPPSLDTTCLKYPSTPVTVSSPLLSNVFCSSTGRPAKQSVSLPARSPDDSPSSSNLETSQTDFAALDVLSDVPAPTTAVDACTGDGFALNSGVRVSGSGVLLIGGEVFRWKPWLAGGQMEPDRRISVGGVGDTASQKGEISGDAIRMQTDRGTALVDAKGRWLVPKEAWGILDLVWPKPDILILGTGRHVWPLSPSTRQLISNLGVRVDVLDTRNAAAQFNLLATERGTQQVAAALVPIS